MFARRAVALASVGISSYAAGAGDLERADAAVARRA